MNRVRVSVLLSFACFTLCALIPVLLSSCTSIALYDERAYEQATSLKVESLALMDKAVEEYDIHKTEAENLKIKLKKAYEYATGRPKNEISAKQWQTLIEPERKLLGGFLKRWEENSSLSAVFIKEAKGLISDSFDTIIGLESGKVKPNDLKK